MALFSTAYSLCTLADQKGFLHAYADEEDCALVTLGKNIVISYRLSSQKQLNSWSTIQKLSSKVVYNDKNGEYLAVFNNVTIKRWTKQEANLEKASKIKLKEPAHEILIGNEPVVLFKTGACATITYCQDKGHQPLEGFLPKESTIHSAKIAETEDENFLFLTAVDEKNHMWCYSVQLDNTNFQIIHSTLKKVLLRKRGQELLGSCFITRDSEEGLVTIWSDGFIYLLSLPVQSQEVGRFVGTVRTLATTSSIAVLAVSAHHVVLYGGDPSEEGAVLAIYNLNFGMVQASMSFKFLQKPPRIWAVHGRLLVGVGQRIVCVPYSLETGRVEALVGTRPVKTADTEMSDIQPVVETAGWEDGAAAEMFSGAPQKLKDIIENLTDQGCSEAGICSTILADLIDEQDVGNLSWCLDHFIDIPETLCVQLVNLALTADDSAFTGGSKTGKRRSKTLEKRPHMNGGGKAPKNQNPVHPHERSSFLGKILNVPVSNSNLFSALRTGLKFEQCLELLEYLTYSISSGTSSNDENILDWATTVIDAFYQQFILTSDSKVLESVLELQVVINDQVEVLNDMSRLIPLLKRVAYGQKLPEKSVQAKSYSIQKLQLYK